MRISHTAFLSCCVLAGVMLAAAGAAADTCKAGAYTIATAGPSVGTSSTTITYTVTGSPTPDHVATVVASESTNCFTTSITSVTGSNPPTGNQAYGPGVGDPVTGLGKWACHEEAAKINPNGTVSTQFTVTVSGARSPAQKSVVVKKGSTIKSCEIVGIGDPTTETPAPVTEIISEPSSHCAVEFTKDILTGKVIHAELTPESVAAGCDFIQTTVENLTLAVKGLPSCPTQTLPDGSCPIGDAKFGEGYVHSGNGSCTTKVVGGKVYTWGSPCPTQ